MEVKVNGIVSFFGGDRGEVKYTSAGKPYMRFSIGERDRRDADNVTWHQATAWGDLAVTLANALEKNALVKCEGYNARAKAWKTFNEGEDVPIQFSVSDRADFQVWKGGKASDGGQFVLIDDVTAETEDDEAPGLWDDEIPF